MRGQSPVSVHAYISRTSFSYSGFHDSGVGK